MRLQWRKLRVFLRRSIKNEGELDTSLKRLKQGGYLKRFLEPTLLGKQTNKMGKHYKYHYDYWSLMVFTRHYERSYKNKALVYQ